MASIFQRKKGGTWWIKYYANGRQVAFRRDLQTGELKFIAMASMA